VSDTLIERQAPADGPRLPRARHPVDPALILDSVDEAIFVFDPETLEIAEANRRAAELLGRPPEELIGESVVEAMPGVDAQQFGAHVAAVLAGSAHPASLIVDPVAAEGRSSPVEVLLQPVDLADGSRMLVALARDVRSRIQTQIRLQRLAELEHARAAELNAVIRAMGEAVIVCAADGSITLLNPAAESMFPEVEERTYADVLAELQDPDGLAPRLGTSGGPVQLKAARPPERWVEIATYPVGTGSSGSGPVEATIVVLRDVTQARHLEAVRETFIGILSHELRTPVTTIFGGAKLLAREHSSLDEETRRGIFRDIYEEAERLQRLVEDVVALNRFGEEVAGEIGREPVLLQRLLPGVVRSEDGRWPGVTFKLEMASGLPTVSADPTYVEQVIRNLLSNAAKYGGIHSTVHIQAEAGENEVIVRVLDDGPGFPIEERDRLFELFYRSARTAGAAGGAGIGLFVCARLVAAMGGRIWAEPRAEEGGAEFGFALPELSE
jgi:PAS domain S-box-containing protein